MQEINDRLDDDRVAKGNLEPQVQRVNGCVADALGWQRVEIKRWGLDRLFQAPRQLRKLSWGSMMDTYLHW